MRCEKAVGKNIAALNVGKRATPHKCKLFPLTLAKKSKLHTNIFGGKIKLHTLQMQTVSFAQIYLIRFGQMKEILLMSSIMHKYAQICSPQVSHIPMHNFLYFQAFHHQGRFFSVIFLFYSLLKKCNSVSLSLKLPCTKLQFCLQLPRRGQINRFGEEIRIFLLHKYFFLAEKYNAQDCKRLPKENYQLHLWYVPNQLSSPPLP